MKTCMFFVIQSIFVLSLTHVGHSQCALQDARELTRYVIGGRFASDSTSKKIVAGYLEMYLSQEDRAKKLSTDEILTIVQLDNPFLGNTLTSVSGTAAGEYSPTSRLVTAAGALGGLDVTNIADGLAKFLVARGEEEIETSFFRALRDSLGKHEELSILFPSTTLLLGSIEYWNYGNFLNTLREAFNKDLKVLPRSIVNLKYLTESGYTGETKKIAEFVKTDEGRILLSCAEWVDDMDHGRLVPDAIDSIASSSLIGGAPNADLSNVFKLMAILSTSVRSAANSGYVRVDSLRAALKDTLTRNIYFGLVWQKIHGDDIRIKGVNIETVFIPKNTEAAVLYIKGTLEAAQSLVDAVDNLAQKKSGPQVDLAQYYLSVMNSANKLIRVYATMSPLHEDLSVVTGVNKVMYLSSYAFTMVQDISLRNYNAVVLDAIEILREAGTDSISVRKLARYASFAANVVSAKNSDEVKNAIEAMALPAGSSQIKRESKFDLALNAYIGAYGGQEWISRLKNSAGFSYGMTAPLGVTVSWGHQFLIWNTSDVPWSTSLFVSFIDVGAIAAFRTGGDSISQISTVQLKDIVSLGAFLSIGVPYMPVSLNAGIQTGPNLFSVASSSNNYRDVPYYRWSISVCVDIPLFDFHTTPRN